MPEVEVRFEEVPINPDFLVRCGFCGALVRYGDSYGNYFVGRVCKDCYESRDEYGYPR